ncbi:MAG: phosphatidylserine/phosphatidylglycerophosphate/cardiolipin synthase family protein [Candidatus Bathyarchaeia archaeon]
MTINFDFSDNVITQIIEEINTAKEYIRIAIFQLHNVEVFEALQRKLDEGVKVEIFTLPFDSLKAKVRAETEKNFQKIAEKGAEIRFNQWGEGNPDNTRTAVEGWYCFHGKFIVTDQSAIALSANFTNKQELDAILIYRNDQLKIKEFNDKLDFLKNLFINPKDRFDGEIRELITKAVNGDTDKIFALPKRVNAIHEGHWIRKYPNSLIVPVTTLEEKLYLTPFDGKGREIFRRAIAEAEQFIFLSTESFTDMEFANSLIELLTRKAIDVKIVTGTESRDFKERVNELFKGLLTQTIGLRTTEGNSHAKLMITDKALIVSSVNLNKMNLGFEEGKNFWSENTESIYLSRDPSLVKEAKTKFLSVFDSSLNVSEVLKEKIAKEVSDLYETTFNLRVESQTKLLFAGLLLKQQIYAKRFVIRIGKIAKKLVSFSGKSVVEKNDLLCALVLFYLSELGKQTVESLQERLSEMDKKINVASLLTTLINCGLVEREDNYFKLRVEAALE